MSSEPQPEKHQRECPKCKGAMKWFRSEADKAMSAIQHVFVCEGCGSLENVTGPLTGGPGLTLL